MKRRGFLGAPLGSVLGIGQAKAFERGGWRLEVDAENNIRSCRKGQLELLRPNLLRNRPAVTGPASFDYSVDLVELGAGVAVKQTITLHAKEGKRQRVTVDIPRCLQLPAENRTAFLPMFNGIGRWETAAGLCAAYSLRKAGYYSAIAGIQHVAPVDIGYDKVLRPAGFELRPDMPPGYADYLFAKDVTQLALGFLNHAPKQSFGLTIGYGETHRNFHPPGPTEDPRFSVPPPPHPDVLETRYRVSIALPWCEFHPPVRSRRSL